MNEGELGGAAANATTAINDEISRSHHVTDPGAGRPSLMIPHLASLKRRHEFLNEAAFFYKERKRTQRTQPSFIKNVKERSILL